MIDIHAHIIPNIDDGAEDIADAILMAELAAEGGVHTLIATPHSNIPGSVENYYDQELVGRFQNLRNEINERQIPIELLLGMEIYATEDMPQKIRDHRLISLNDSGYYLMEFGFEEELKAMTKLLEQICDMGVVPIVAHPERYRALQNRPKSVTDWIDLGVQLQINRGTLFGRFGRSAFCTAKAWLKNDCITYVASDAHSPYHRTTFMGDVEDYLKTEYSQSVANRLLRENQRQYLI